ncbi:MAG: hypothetical protein HYV42_05020 [Candidatus Magasanikbacteria bacterium]|nr:hypothetical protein [Candidatus Magasanikbacteria bacterium]
MLWLIKNIWRGGASALILLAIFAQTVSVLAAEERETAETPTASAVVEETFKKGPAVRVLIAEQGKPVTMRSEVPVAVYTGVILRLELPPETLITIRRERQALTIESEGVSFGTEEPVRIMAEDPLAVFTLPGFARKLSGWKQDFNQYRGILELRLAKDKNLLLINELPLEAYVAAIVETNERDPEEYTKAVLVAARTYAVVWREEARRRGRAFDLRGSTHDQLYLGYQAELAQPQVRQWAGETAGEVVTYEGSPAATLYFGHSTGKTKSWPKRLGERPWLTSVAAPYDKKFKRLYGHGYGMSMNDARERARRDNATYQELLAYYYTGTQVEVRY